MTLIYNIISGDMVVKRVPSPVLSFSAPGRVVTSAAEYSRSTSEVRRQMAGICLLARVLSNVPNLDTNLDTDLDTDLDTNLYTNIRTKCPRPLAHTASAV